MECYCDLQKACGIERKVNVGCNGRRLQSNGASARANLAVERRNR